MDLAFPLTIIFVFHCPGIEATSVTASRLHGLIVVSGRGSGVGARRPGCDVGKIYMELWKYLSGKCFKECSSKLVSRLSYSFWILRSQYMVYDKICLWPIFGKI